MIRSASKQQRSESDSLKADFRFQRRLLEGAQTAKMELYEDFISGKTTKEEYLKKKAELNNKEQSAKMQIALVEERLKELSQAEMQSDTVSEEESIVNKYLNISSLDDALMQELVKKIVIFPDGAISIVWNFRDLFDGSATEQLG